jgi:uncharacterized OsmC-like protein
LLPNRKHEVPVTDPSHPARVRITPATHRIWNAEFPSGASFYLRQSDASDAEVPNGAPALSEFDHIVAAVASSLADTFAQALAARGVEIGPGELSVSAVGEVELSARVPVLKRINVTYYLSAAAAADPETADAVWRFHTDACPAYRTIHPQVHVTTAVEFV